jgi:hypothetical protein
MLIYDSASISCAHLYCASLSSRVQAVVVQVASGAQRVVTVCVFHWRGRFHAG